MSRFAQYYIKYKHDAGCYEWEQRQQHLGTLFENDESIEFCLGEGEIYKHKIYHLQMAPGISIMRFANNIDIPIEKNFESETVRDEPSCFVIIDNRDHLRTVAIQKRKRAFSNTHKVAKILSLVIDQHLFRDHCYGFEILPDYYPAELFKVWEMVQERAQAICFGMPEMDRDEIFKKIEKLRTKRREYFDDSIMGAVLDVLYAQQQAKYKGRFQVMPEQKKTALYVDKTSVFMRNLLTLADAVDEPIELVTSDGATFRCFINNDEDNTDRIVSHEFNDGYLEMLFNTRKADGSKIEPEDRLKAEEEVVGLMNGMKHEVTDEEEERAA